MSRTRNTRRQREMKLSRMLMAAFALILLVCVFSQVAMLVRLSGQNRQAVSIEREIRSLSAQTDNLRLSLNQYHNLERIAVRAQQMGMEQPAQTQIRVVSLPVMTDGTFTQSAGTIGTEGMMD